MTADSRSRLLHCIWVSEVMHLKRCNHPKFSEICPKIVRKFSEFSPNFLRTFSDISSMFLRTCFGHASDIERINTEFSPMFLRCFFGLHSDLFRTSIGLRTNK